MPHKNTGVFLCRVALVVLKCPADSLCTAKG